MLDLPEHYTQLLGLDDSWRVGSVDLSLTENRVTTHLHTVANRLWCCPNCEAISPLKDHAPERQWRYLDTMQFQTTLVAQVPRTKCSHCGVK
ncbi:MAG: transposase family protein, partial [bacterium]|nr:transposase family protein [bacterium]